MEKVLFKKWIRGIAVESKYDSLVGNTITKWKKGTNRFEDDFCNEGLFMGFGVDYEELNDGVGQYTNCLIRTNEGLIERVLIENVKFI